jgi:hypothetical protein
MKTLFKLLLILALSLLCAVAVILPVYAQDQPVPPTTPDSSWQPPFESGQPIEPSVSVESYNQLWSTLIIPPPSPIAPGLPSSIINAYIVNSQGQLVNTLYRNELCYLIVSFNGPGYFYLWEYYPAGSHTYGHWLCYRWYRPSAGVWKIGPFVAESWEPAGQYIWKMWFVSGSTWTTRTLSFNYIRDYYLPGISFPTPLPTPINNPVIDSFTANLSTIDAGQTVTLTWTTTNAISVTISPGIGTVAASGSTTVTPANTTTYTLTASGYSGTSVTSSVTVTVMPRVLPVINIDPSTIQKGNTATISWKAPGALQVTISNIGNVGTTGSVQITPQQTKTFTLNAVYPDGTSQSTSVTVNVQQPPYLLWIIVALLAAAAVVITILLLTRGRKAGTATASPAQTVETAIGGATTPSDQTQPSTTSVIDVIPAKLVTPDGSEILLAGNNRSFGRRDFEKFMPPDKAFYISRQHINIWYDNKQYYIEDRGSTNGTRINGIEIRGGGRRPLEDGDTIDLAGKLTITFKK